MGNRAKLLQLILIIVTGYLSGCNVADSDSTSSFDSKGLYKLYEKDQYTLPAESYLINSIQYFEDNGRDYISILNGINNEILLYDFDRKTQVGRIPVPDLGVKSILLHRMNNLDSIQIANFFTRPTIYTLNGKGEIVNELPVYTYIGKDILSFPISLNSLPVQYINGEYYIPLRPYSWDTGIDKESFKDYYSYITIDSCGNRKHRYKLPEIYDEFFWGTYMYKYAASLCPVIGSKNCYFVGHAVDPCISQYNSDNLVNRKPIASKIVDSIIPFYDDVKKYKKLIRKITKGKARAPDPNSMKEWARSSSDYGRIVYDPNSDLYLRTVYVRPDLEQVKEGLLAPNFSFIIFNRDLQWLGETLLPEGYNGEVLFVTEEGIHIQKESQEGIVFTIFEIVKE